MSYFHQKRLFSSSEKITNKKPSLTFTELLVIEQKRRDLLQQVKAFNVWRIAFAYHGTMFETILLNLETWICICTYVTIRSILWLQLVDIRQLPTMDIRYLTVVGGFLSFMMVFYTNQTYSRLTSQYYNSMKIETKILNLVLQVRCNLPTAESWRFVRYLNAVHLLGYIGLSDTYTVENFFDPMNDIHHFLSEDEVRRVKMIGADAQGAGYRELLSWVLEILNEAVRTGKMKDKLMGNMVKEVMFLHEAISSLYDFGDQPIPFIYIHIIFFLCLIYLPLFSYSVALSLSASGLADIIGILIVTMNTVFFLGLREVGHFLADPYGADLHDLSVIHYIEATMLSSRRILTGHTLPPQTIDVETALEKARPSRGIGFQDGCMTPVVFTDAFRTLVKQPTMGQGAFVVPEEQVKNNASSNHSSSAHNKRSIFFTSKTRVYSEIKEDCFQEDTGNVTEMENDIIADESHQGPIVSNGTFDLYENNVNSMV